MLLRWTPVPFHIYAFITKSNDFKSVIAYAEGNLVLGLGQQFIHCSSRPHQNSLHHIRNRRPVRFSDYCLHANRSRPPEWPEGVRRKSLRSLYQPIHRAPGNAVFLAPRQYGRHHSIVFAKHSFLGMIQLGHEHVSHRLS